MFEKTTVLPVSPDEAFALLTDPERLRRWQAVTARVDLRAGGEYRWTVTPGNIAAGTFKEIEPGRRLVFGWGWETNSDALAPDASTVTVTFAAEGDGTRVTLTHEGLDADQAVGHAEGWNHYFERLESLAGAGDVGADEWAWAPADLNPLSSAEATLAVLQPVLRNLTDDDRHKQTPCKEYDAHQLVEHLFGSIRGIGALAGTEVSIPQDGGLEHKVSSAAAQVVEAWRARGLDGSVGSDSELPAASAVGILSVEFLVHAWDFAQTSGQQVAVSDEVADYVLSLARQVITTPRNADLFDDEVAPAVDAGRLDRLLAFTGRTV